MSWESYKKITKDYLLTRVIPSNWKTLEIPFFDELVGFVRNDGLKLIITVEWQSEEPETKWLHISMSFRSKLPSYSDLKICKNVFIGEDRTAFQVFPPSDRHVNLHENTLHLFCCLTDDVFPDFRREGGI